jgi:preprotein translocase SecF subunit
VYLEMQVNLWQVNADLKTEDFQNEINASLEKDPLLRKAGRESSAEYQGIQVSSVELVGKPTPEMPVTRYVIRTTPYRPPLEAGSLSDRTVPAKRQVEDAIRSYFRGQPKEKLEISEPFEEVLTVGPRVASNLQLDALVAVFISFLGIVFYLSLRFEFIYGFAGVLALVHDIMVAIGIMAVTDQFLPSFTIKFNLNELAAILTIIGFSINDTIVLFDRIRENSEILAKRKYTLEDIVDISVNQTLSRTLWTSMTVLMVLVILLAFGGDSVRGFSFLFAVGTVSGVYSTVFIAAPVAIYMNKRALRRRQQMALAEQ